MAGPAPHGSAPATALAAPARRERLSAGSGGDGGLRKAAEQFEAVILRQLLASMRQAKLGDDMMGSSATDNFREMADARTADSIAAMRQFGIADMVERQFRGQLGRAAGGIQ